MTADREALKAAVLKALSAHMVGIPILPHHRQVADAIVDAVIAVDRQSGSVEWSPRYADGSQMFAASFTEAGARRYVDESKGGLALYRRHCGPWELVPE